MSALLRRANDLLAFCFSKPTYKISYDTPVVLGFINSASTEDELSKIWSLDSAYDVLFYLINTYITENRNLHPPINSGLVNSFIDQFRHLMQKQITDYWLILPLQTASPQKIYKFDKYIFLPESISRQEKLKLLADLISIPYEEMNFRANHTEKSRSPCFFDYTLLCHKLQHHSSWIYSRAQSITLFDVAALRTLKNSLSINSKVSPSLRIVDRRERNQHILIHAQDASRWGHVALWAQDSCSEINDDLHWLNDRVLVKKFIRLTDLLGYGNRIDHLAYRFRQALILYSKAIDIHISGHLITEGFALELLHYLIAAEVIFLDREKGKRKRLANLISHFSSVKGKTKHEINSVIDRVYTLRSDYVHSGKDVFSEYDKESDESEIIQDLALVRHCVSQVIVDADHFFSLLDCMGLQNCNKTSAQESRENNWFRYLKSINNEITT